MLPPFTVPTIERKRAERKRSARLRLSKSRIAFAFGKEDSYERNPSGVSFVFNHRIFRTFMKVLKMRAHLVKNPFLTR